MSALKCISCGAVVHDPIVVTACPQCGINGGMRTYGIPDIIDAIRADLRAAREADALLHAEMMEALQACQTAIERLCEPVVTP